MQMGKKAVISDERHLKRWPPQSWIYYFSRFWSHDLFLVATITTFLQNFMNLFQSVADLLCFVLKYKMVTIAMLNFIFVSDW